MLSCMSLQMPSMLLVKWFVKASMLSQLCVMAFNDQVLIKGLHIASGYTQHHEHALTFLHFSCSQGIPPRLEAQKHPCKL